MIVGVRILLDVCQEFRTLEKAMRTTEGLALKRMRKNREMRERAGYRVNLNENIRNQSESRNQSRNQSQSVRSFQHQHCWSYLRIIFKWKFFNGIKTQTYDWTQIKGRPITSYFKHAFKQLYSYTSRVVESVMSNDSDTVGGSV